MSSNTSQPTPAKTDAVAIACLAMALIGAIPSCFSGRRSGAGGGIALGVLAVFTGVVSIFRIRLSRVEMKGTGLSVAGIIIGILDILGGSILSAT